ncbi:esterase E4-like [Daphnia pulicaria]|uniref:esterase E4-like n=1 Tax=Daphnia pulicaria TaxID=35523 RepID=UPI001EEBE8BA|nr:esterase E4-like [Daphnia pulicaria]
MKGWEVINLDFLKFLLILILALPCLSVMNRPAVKVTTNLGRVTGTEETIGPEDGFPIGNGGRGRFFRSFRGIPYAKPPIGELRWKDPVPYGLWPTDLDGTNFGQQCPQFDRVTGQVIGNEDCLFLNIFTPYISVAGRAEIIQSDETSRQDRQQKPLLPVMVWFHGGGYVRGSSHQFGPAFLMREDVVLVTVNYRLGVLGFLSTGDRNLPGNYGMLDQIESLKWVKNHVSDFGGDPQQVTIFGESAGGAITHLLALSPLAAGLFHKFILQSASALCDWSIEKSPLEYALKVADGLQCSGRPDSIVHCLKNQSVDHLIRKQTELLQYSLFPVRCAPVLDAQSRDHPFLPEPPQDIIKNRRYNPLPMMSGLNPDEGLLFYLWIHYENMAKMTSKTFLKNELVPGVIASLIKNVTELDSTVKIIQEQYFGNMDYGDSRHFVPRFSQLIEDSSFTSCVYSAQLLHANSSAIPSYAYLFSYKGEKTPSYSAAFADLVRMTGFDHPLISRGVTHADELLYLFRMAGLTADYSQRDMQMSRIMTRLWASFAKTGNPLTEWPYPEIIPNWPHVSLHNGLDGVLYLNLDLPATIIGLDFRKAEHNFWMNVIPHIRYTTATSNQKSNECFSAVWSLLSLLIASLIIIVLLTCIMLLNKRKRRYPERGVVLQRNN